MAEATTISGRIDVPITAGTIVLGALVGLWALHRLTVTLH